LNLSNEIRQKISLKNDLELKEAKFNELNKIIEEQKKDIGEKEAILEKVGLVFVGRGLFFL
jgi:hypothetical protein